MPFEQLFFYAVTPEAEPTDITPMFIDISAPEYVTAWTAAMNAHATQVSARNYIDLQLTRARLLGARAGVESCHRSFSKRAARVWIACAGGHRRAKILIWIQSVD